METGCPYPLNEDDPPVTRLVAMLLLATQANAQVYHLHLSDNTCRITECVDTPQGVKPWVRHGKETPSMIVSR